MMDDKRRTTVDVPVLTAQQALLATLWAYDPVDHGNDDISAMCREIMGNRERADALGLAVVDALVTCSQAVTTDDSANRAGIWIAPDGTQVIWRSDSVQYDWHLREDPWCDALRWAEQVLPLFEDRHPKDKRPREAIAAARHYLYGAADHRGDRGEL